MLSAVGLIFALGLLIYLTIKGLNILIAAPFCAAIVALTSGVPWLPPLAGEGAADFATSYMTGFTAFFKDWFFMFLLGAIFGEVMRVTGAADAIASAIINRFGPDYVLMAVVISCAVLTYGGVSVFIVAFSVYPMAISMFRFANLPRRFIPGTIAFGSVTFTMTSAGSPEIQNLIPMQYLGTKATAAWEVSLVIAIFMAVIGYMWLSRMMKKALLSGETFEARDSDQPVNDEAGEASAGLSLIPLITVFAVFLWTQFPDAVPGIGSVLPEDGLGKWGLLLALGGGALVAAIIGWRHYREYPAMLTLGATGAVIAIVNTCAVVGFASIAKLSPAFTDALAALQGMPGDPLIGAAIAVTVIAALTGSASGGQTVALPLIAPGYLDAGAQPDELHRVVAISSGALDSLPHNGFVITLIRAICGETHKSAYLPLGALTVVVPTIGLALAVLMFIIW
jgi:H+/gluconate symporter-like permease